MPQDAGRYAIHHVFPAPQDRILSFHRTESLDDGIALAVHCTGAVDSFAFAAIRDLYALSVLLLARKFGWPLPSRMYHRLDAEEVRNHPNHQPVIREPVTPAIQDLLLERTRIERPVYEYAVRRFTAEFRECFGLEIPANQLPLTSTTVNC